MSNFYCAYIVQTQYASQQHMAISKYANLSFFFTYLPNVTVSEKI